MWINVWVASKTVWSVVNTLPYLSWGELLSHDKALYKSTFTLL